MGERSRRGDGGPRSKPRALDLGACLFATWRDESLRDVLVASGAIHLIIWLLSLVGGAAPRFALGGLALAVGGVHLVTLLLPVTWRATRVAILFASVFIELIAVGSIAGWQPEFSLLALFLSVYGGLLLPRGWSWLPPFGVFGFFLVFVQLDPPSRLAPSANLDNSEAWIRVAISYALITAGMAYSLERALELLRGARRDAAAALVEAKAERRRADAIHETIEAAEREMAKIKDGEAAREVAATLRGHVDEMIGAARGLVAALRRADESEKIREVARRMIAIVTGTAEAVRQALDASRGRPAQVLVEPDVSEPPRDSAPPAWGDVLAAWKTSALNIALGLATAVYGIASIGHALSFSSERPYLVNALPELLAAIGSSIGFVGRRFPVAVRVGILLAALGVPNFVTVLTRGYMSTTSVLALSSACLCAAVYANRKTTVALLIGTTCAFALGTLGPLRGEWWNAEVTPMTEANWWRLALVFPAACWGMSRVVLHLLESARRSLDDLNASFEELSLARRDREQVSRRLSDIQSEAARPGPPSDRARSVRRDAHDLGNSLAVLLGWSEHLARTPEPSPSIVAQAADTCAEVLDEAEEQLRTLAALSSPDSGNVRVNA